ncbi:MAG: oligosaccharide flippase family protein [Actinomycetia bacterium]|nr:oligosaccharide flippase family protein [Actinomycetes bacterium]
MSQIKPAERSNLRQAHWGLISQALNTGSNFLLSVLVARAVTATEFGAFAVVMVLYMVGVAIVRTTGIDVLSISYAGTDELRPRARGMLTYACSIGVLFGLLCTGVGVLLIGRLDPTYVLLAGSLPLLFGQEAMRGVAFARGQPKSAASNDGLRAVLQVAVVATFGLSGSVTIFAAVSAWAFSGSVAGIVACLAWRHAPAVQWPHRWFIENRALAAPLGASGMLAYLPKNLTYLLMPSVALLSELGVLRAAYLFFGPLGMLHLTLRSLILPDAARISSARAVHRLFIQATLVISAISVGWGVLVVALPDPVGLWLLGDLWNGTFVPRILLGVSLVAEAVMTCAVGALGTFGLAKRIVRVQLIMAPLTLVGVLALAAAYGATGAAAGFALCYSASAVLAWVLIPSGARLDDISVGSTGRPNEMGRT